MLDQSLSETTLEADLRKARERIDYLQRAVEVHGRIGQAVGILMCRYTISPEAAFAALSQVAQDRHLKLRSLAEAVIATIGFPDTPLPRELKDALGEILQAGERPQPG